MFGLSPSLTMDGRRMEDDCAVNEFIDARLEQVRQDQPDNASPIVGESLSCYDLTLDFEFLNILNEEQKKFVNRTLFDGEALATLEREKILNWPHAYSSSFLRPAHSQACKVVALRTRADGNCLLHAVSLAMWGIDDSGLRLREVLYVALNHGASGALRRRWRSITEAENRRDGFTLAEDQWDQEWITHIVRRCAPLQRTGSAELGNSGQYGSLGDFHIFTLAQVLRRPIVCYAAETMRSVSGNHLAPNSIGGIYLPLTADPNDCVHSPLMIAFTGGHFVGLVRENGVGYAPLCGNNFKRLPIQFMTEEERGNKEMLLDQYLVHRYLQLPPLPGSSVFHTFQPMAVAEVQSAELPADLLRLPRTFVETFHDLYYEDVARHCRTAGCGNLHMERSPFCLRCVAEHSRSAAATTSQSADLTAASAGDGSIVSSVPATEPLSPTAPLLSELAAAQAANIPGSGDDRPNHLLSPQYCHTIGCSKPRHPNLNGKCSDCHRSGVMAHLTRVPTADAVASNSAGRGGTPSPHNPDAPCPRDPGARNASSDAEVDATPALCVEPGCTHYGSEDFDRRCSRCYMSRRERERSSSSMQRAGAASTYISNRHAEPVVPARSPIGTAASTSASAAAAGPAAPVRAAVAAAATGLASSGASSHMTCALDSCLKTHGVTADRRFCADCTTKMETLYEEVYRHRHRWTCATANCKTLCELPAPFCDSCSGAQSRPPPTRSRSSKGKICRRQPHCQEKVDYDTSRQYGGLCAECFAELGGETRCKTSGCGFFGSAKLAGFCSSCSERQRKMRVESQQRAALRDVRDLSRPAGPAAAAPLLPVESRICTACHACPADRDQGGLCYRCVAALPSVNFIE